MQSQIEQETVALKQSRDERASQAQKFDAELEAGLRDAITEFKAQYVKDNPKALAA